MRVSRFPESDGFAGSEVIFEEGKDLVIAKYSGFKKFQNPKFHTEIQVEANGFSQVAWTVGIKHLEGAWLSCDSVGLALPQAGGGPEEAGQQIPTVAQALRPPQHQEGENNGEGQDPRRPYQDWGAGREVRY